MSGARLEDRRHVALGRPLAHEGGIATGADSQRKSVEQDRLAGARLAGKHGKAVLELDIERGTVFMHEISVAAAAAGKGGFVSSCRRNSV